MKWMTCIKKVSAEGHEALDAKVNTLIKVLKTRNGSSSKSWVQMSNNGKRRCWPMSPKPWENAEGYADPTAYNAFIIAESGFELAARIELRDRKTGRFFR